MLITYIKKFKNKGLTLLEIIIAAAIMVLLLTTIHIMVVRGMRIFTLGNARGKMQGNALMAMSRITRELMESNIRSVSTIPYGTASNPFLIGFLSGVELDGSQITFNVSSGRMDWQKYIIYYLAPSPNPEYLDSALFRKEYDPTDPNTPPGFYEYDLLRTEILRESDLKGVCDGTVGLANERIIAHGVYSLEAELPLDYVNERYITLTFKTQEIALDKEDPEQMEYVTRIYFRN